jgi:hypothetical protein
MYDCKKAVEDYIAVISFRLQGKRGYLFCKIIAREMLEEG